MIKTKYKIYFFERIDNNNKKFLCIRVSGCGRLSFASKQMFSTLSD